jgi:hypothetical protein
MAFSEGHQVLKKCLTYRSGIHTQSWQIGKSARFIVGVLENEAAGTKTCHRCSYDCTGTFYSLLVQRSCKAI